MATYYSDIAGVNDPIIDHSGGLTVVPFTFAPTVALVTNDIARLVKIPLGATLIGFWFDGGVMGAATTVFNVGDSGSATRFSTGVVASAVSRISSFDVLSAAATGAAAGSLPRRYTAADDLRLTFTTVATGTVSPTAFIKGFAMYQTRFDG
jgi:hypothetical protein